MHRSITSSIAGATATTRKLGVETGARYSSITTNVGSKHPAAISTVRSATRKLSSYLRVARGSEDENTTLYALMAVSEMMCIDTKPKSKGNFHFWFGQICSFLCHIGPKSHETMDK